MRVDADRRRRGGRLPQRGEAPELVGVLLEEREERHVGDHLRIVHVDEREQRQNRRRRIEPHHRADVGADVRVDVVDLRRVGLHRHQLEAVRLAVHFDRDERTVRAHRRRRRCRRALQDGVALVGGGGDVLVEADRHEVVFAADHQQHFAAVGAQEARRVVLAVFDHLLVARRRQERHQCPFCCAKKFAWSVSITKSWCVVQMP